MSALTSLLVRDRILPLEKIEEAIQKQVIAGGELDTALLELRLVAENVMAAYCAATHGVLPATVDEVMTVGRDTIRVVPKEVAEKHRIVPMRSEEGSLVVAVSQPLAADVEQQLSFLLGAQLVQRVVAEVRVAAALHHHYGLPMSPRHRRLVEKLRKVEPGAIPYVRPTSEAKLDPSRLAGSTEAADGLEASDAGESAAPDGGPAEPGPAEPDAAEPDAAEPDEAEPNAAEPEDRFPAHGPVTARYGIPRGATGTGPSRRARRGPLTTDAAARELREAKTRDDILRTLLDFAQQYFDYTALFVVRKNEARGRLAAGEGVVGEPLREVRIPLDMPGAFKDAFAVCAPRHSYFDTEADELTLSSLARAGKAPAAVMPVTIRERVVILLYGDMGGEAFDLADIPEVLALLPHATRAFGAVLMAKKLGGFKRADGPKKSELKVRPGSMPPPQAAFSPDDGRAPVEVPRAPRPAAFDLLGVPKSAPPPPMPDEAALAVEAHEARAQGQRTRREPSTDAEDEPGDAAPTASVSEPPAEVESDDGRAADDAGMDAVGADDAEPTRDEPARSTQDSPSSRHHDSTPELAFDEDWEDEDWEDEDWEDEDWNELKDDPDLEGEDADSSGPRPRTPAASPASSVYMMSGVTSDHVESSPPTEEDRRRASGGAPPTEEVLTVTEVTALGRGSEPEVRSSLPPDSSAKVIVDMGAPVEEAVLDLMRCGPGDELPAVARVVRVGDAALPVLGREFPGPLWFDRHEPHRKLPRGRDISAIARALVALSDRAVSYLPAIIDDPADTERRFYGTLLASEMPHPELVPALGRRLLDEDAGVRDLSTDVLRLHLGFEEAMTTLLEGVRAIAKVPRADAERRVRAVDALGRLHDARSLRTLVDLLGSDVRPLRTAARWALVSLTRRDLGKSQGAWKTWAEKNGTRHRIEWLIDALMSDDEKLREAASNDLKRLTQQYHGYHPKLGKHEREVAQRRYQAWWDEEGRALFADAPEHQG